MKKMHKILSLLLISSLLLSACSGGRGRRSHNWRRVKTEWTVEKRIKGKPSDVKLVVNDRVRNWLDYFTGPGRARFGRYLKRSGRYIPLMKKILRDYGLPEDVVYIALIESGFTSSAKSWASAVGFWQFIGSTGRRYNLRIDPFIDERQCYVKSTHAAARYLSDLYNMFGDWYLAFAGYNSGEGKVQRAIKMYGTKNFWNLTTHRRRYFKPETKNYVPKYIAAAMIAKNPRKYGFRVDYHEPLEYDEVKASTQTDFEVIAKASRSSYNEIAVLNPHLLMGVTPPGERNYPIRVPAGKGGRFLKAFARIPKSKRVTKNYSHMIASRSNSGIHVVKRGETLSKIARKYGVSMRKLKHINKIRNSRHLRRGQKLKIPGRVSQIKYAKQSQPSRSTTRSTTEVASKTAIKKSTPRKLIRHRVSRGDTLGGIAQKYDVKIADLKRWNKIRGNRIIRGKRLKVYQGGTVSSGSSSEPVQVAAADTVKVTKSKKVTYKVKSGDTLSKIARNNKISISELRKLNEIKGSTIRPGQVLNVGKKLYTVEVPVENAYASKTSITSSSSSGGTYKIRRGDSWWSIAKKNKMTVAQLKKLNPGKGRYLKAGQNLILNPAAATTTAPSISSSRIDVDAARARASKPVASRTASLNTYKVKRGDTLYAIALRTKTSISELCKYNNISRTSVLKPGMILKVKNPASKSAVMSESARSERLVLSSAEKPTKTVNYKVKSGDNAWNIAKKHNVSLKQIKGWNTGVDLTKLKPGDTLKLKVASRKSM